MKICYNCFNDIPDSAKTCPRCGSSADLRNGDKYPYALPCGSVLNGRYIVGRVLGQGGFGITYAGQQYDTKQPVAIKEYFPGVIASRNISHSVIPFSKDRDGDYEYGKKQFLDEAKTLSAFIGSPNIVRVFGYFEENGTAYFVMEYVEGRNLRQYIAERGGRISWEETWSLLMPVLDALSEVHYRNIIHRDIKPDNIIITNSGNAKLIDFGAARYNHGEKSKSLTAVLTPGYAPLEQYFTRGRQGPWTDVYALAATMYYCITGKVPIEAVERSVNDDLKKPSELGVTIPDHAETALMKALSVREEDRYRSTYDFRNAVLEGKHREREKTYGTGIGGSGTPAPAGERSGQESSREDSYRKALDLALQGDPDAQYLLGYFYESGKGVQQSDELAEKWYRRAAAQGNSAARTKLSLFAEKHSGAGQDKKSPGTGRDDNREGRGAEESGELLQGSSASAGQPQPFGNKAESGSPKNIGSDTDSEGTHLRGSGTNGKSPEGGTTDQGTIKPVSQKKGDAGRSSKIILALGLIVLIAVAGFVISNIKSSQSTVTDTVDSEQIAEKTDNTGGQDASSPQEEKEEKEQVQTSRTSDAPFPQEEKEEEESLQTSRTSDKPKVLTDTWEEIAAAGRDGTYKERYRIGDRKALDMGAEGIITMKLVAMDEDELADGSGKAPMTWVADELLQSEHNMNSELTNEGGWEASGMRAWLRETILPLMPEEVRNNILEVAKYSYSYDEQKGVVSKDTIWIPSAREVFLEDKYRTKDYEKKGVSYTSVFTDNESRKRSRDGESGTPRWWLRSASSKSSTNFATVGNEGGGSLYATKEFGVVVGFCF